MRISGGGRLPARPGCGAGRPGCASRSAEAQGAFVWVTPLRPRKRRPPRAVRRRDGAVGQVKGDSGGSASLSVFVGEGERAAREPTRRHSRRREALSQTPRDSATFAPGRRQYPRWRCIFRLHWDLNPGKKSNCFEPELNCRLG